MTGLLKSTRREKYQIVSNFNLVPLISFGILVR